MKYKKRIIWLHPHFLNWMGGHKYIFEITTRLSNKYQVVVFSDLFSRESKKRFGDAGIKTIQTGALSTNNPLYWILLPYYIFKNLLILRTLINRDDIVISSMFPMNVVAMLLGLKHLQLCYEPFAFFYDTNFINGFPIFQRISIYILKFIYSWLDILATQKASAVLTLSEFNKKWIFDIYRRQSEVVYEGVDTNFFSRKFYKKINNKYKNLNIIFHSTDFTKIKGTEYLFKAIPLILNEIPNLRILISSTIQNNKAKDSLLEYSKNNNFLNKIEFLGYLPYKDLPAYLSMSKVVVQPSVGQSMNLTVKEAMACRTPVITSTEGGEQYKDGEAGFLVDPKNYKKLAKRIIVLLKNKKLSEKMGIKGAKIIKEKFSWDAVFKKISYQIELLQNENK